MEEKDLDFVLVPAGLLVMAVYHVWLLYQIRRKPVRTVVGMNAINRRFWVSSMMEDTQKTGVLAVQTLRNNIMASTLLASTAIMLSSLIAVLMTGGLTAQNNNNNNNNNNRHMIGITFGEGTKLRLTIKFFSILVCFLISFLMNVQSIRYYSHASMLINVPYKKITNFTCHRLTAEYVSSSVNLGSYFWSLGLRAFYFSFPLFLWLFGAIPMFVCSVFLVFMLYFLDVSVDPGWVADTSITTTTTDEESG
ncbi:hypothetical protein HanRHA438_Chr05g0239141 [Helianthus annuus]|uniref:DUF599 domain-containing protein n=1 Tax=Helianthus annuus TaxID=4232 RepID=A0A251TJ86_HELAN|nr:uncharacterized protein LOC110885182 [Helianthus annuus]KAF5807124.1 hypothetical protein HanXRQr2_Chr05g0230041 [Helianthus annuus]KAJ0585649.1 hypothetical protein HanHA89_Chr05g0203151 [Helianthus annuus]KAJ0920239.1 hypothetical protein HanRHA438_Chr05g0239141 [Helianthus annuus]KAJ0923887.1 hypothetical protein HanPSC8_Chr05g0221891 [Helianthus annuus]